MPVQTGFYAPNPLRSVADYSAQLDEADLRRQQMQQNALALQTGQLGLADRQRAIAEQNAMRNALSGLGPTATDEQRINALKGLGTQGGFAAADALEKAIIERQKTAAEVASKNAGTQKTGVETADLVAKQFKDALPMVQSPQAMAQWLQAQYSHPVLGPIISQRRPLQDAIAAIPNDPQGFMQMRNQVALGMEKFIADETAKRGQDTTAATALAGQQRAAADAAANRAIQIRGQNLTDARARETTAATMTKPFEVTGPDGLPMLVQQDKQGNIKPVAGFGPKSGSAKPLTDTQSKALLFGSRARESDAVLAEVGDKYSPMAINAKNAAGKVPLLGGMLEAGSNAMLGDANQKAEQAQRDFVNAVLRRESGAVISEQEFDNARKQYFPQPGDGDAVLKQKAANRQLAINGLLAEVPEGRRDSLSKPPSLPSSLPSIAPFKDADKERRYQEWKKTQGAK